MPRKKADDQKQKALIITWKHSTIGRTQVQKATIQALGFTKLNQTLTKVDNPAIRGMIDKVSHLLEVKES